MFPNYTPKNLFLADILNLNLHLPISLFPIFAIVSGILIWLISKRLFSGWSSFVPVIIYLFSPWIYYLTIAHSFYVYLLLLILITIYGFLLAKSKLSILGKILIVTGTVAAFYSSSIFLILYPLIFIFIFIFKLSNFITLRIPIATICLFYAAIIFLIFTNRIGFNNAIANEVKIFSDPGLLNTINSYQGAATTSGFKYLGKMSENKYLFFSEYFVMKYMEQLVPSATFTTLYRLLGFSFESPILLGFLFPFIYGLYVLFQNPGSRKILFLGSVLVMPSVLANELVSLNRLILFFPTIIYVISTGLFSLYKLRKVPSVKILLVISTLLIFLQSIITITDIRSREMRRFERYFGNNYELPEP